MLVANLIFTFLTVFNFGDCASAGDLSEWEKGLTKPTKKASQPSPPAQTPSVGPSNESISTTETADESTGGFLVGYLVGALPVYWYLADEEMSLSDSVAPGIWHGSAQLDGVIAEHHILGYRGEVQVGRDTYTISLLKERLSQDGFHLDFETIRGAYWFSPRRMTRLGLTLGYKSIYGSNRNFGVELGLPLEVRLGPTWGIKYNWFVSFFKSVPMFAFELGANYKLCPHSQIQFGLFDYIVNARGLVGLRFGLASDF